MYSKADIEMWYDWNRQLENTKWVIPASEQGVINSILEKYAAKKLKY